MNAVVKGIQESAVKSLEKGDKTASMDFRFSPDFIGFGGHYPERPILPAFVQAMIGIYVAGEAVGMKLVLKRLGRAKFLSIVEPGMLVQVQVEISPGKNDVSLSIKLFADEKAASTITAVAIEG